MIVYTLVQRDGSDQRQTTESITLGSLRTLLMGSDEMDELDEFRVTTTVANAQPTTIPVEKGREADFAVTEGMRVAIIPLRVHLIVTDAKGKQHSVYVDPGDTLAAFRNKSQWVADTDAFVANGTEVTRDDESRQYLRSLKSLNVKGPAPRPRGVELLLMDERPPSKVTWSDGSMEKRLSELREFLAKSGKDSSTAFLNAGETQIPREMEDHEPVSILGECDKLGCLRIRFAKREKTKQDDVAPAQPTGEGAPAPQPAPGGDGMQPRVTLQEARDLLKTAFGRPIAGTGPPQDVFTRMPKEDQALWLASMRHLHGLRFVQSGDNSYELERSPCAALSATTRVAVVLPVTTARFMASAAENRTADSVASFLSWNVGADGAAEGKKGSFSLKSEFDETRQRKTSKAETKVFLRAEYLVARGEIVIDPRGLQLDTQLLEEVASIVKANLKEQALPQRFARLFALYGTHVPLRTMFGGKLIFRNERALKSGETSDELTRRFSATVKGSYKSVTATGRGGYKSVDTIQKAWEFSEEAIEVTAAGGNPALALDPYAWAATLSHAGWWSTIAFADIVPLLTLLPRDQLKNLLPLLTKAWKQGVPGPVDWEAYQSAISARVVEPLSLTEQVVPG